MQLSEQRLIIALGQKKFRGHCRRMKDARTDFTIKIFMKGGMGVVDGVAGNSERCLKKSQLKLLERGEG